MNMYYSLYIGETLLELNENKYLLCDSNVNDGVISISISKEINNSDELIFKILPVHPYYSKIKRYTMYVDLFLRGRRYFRGRIQDIKVDSDRIMEVTCDGALAYFRDNYKPKNEDELDKIIASNYTINKLISSYNSDMDQLKRFDLSICEPFELDSDNLITVENIEDGYYMVSDGQYTQSSEFKNAGPFKYSTLYEYSLYAKRYDEKSTVVRYYSLFGENDVYLGWISGTEMTYDIIYENEITPSSVKYFYVNAKVSDGDLFYLYGEETGLGDKRAYIITEDNTEVGYYYDKFDGSKISLLGDDSYRTSGSFFYDPKYTYHLLAQDYDERVINIDRYFSLFAEDGTYLGYVQGSIMSAKNIEGENIDPSNVFRFFVNANARNGDLYWLTADESFLIPYNEKNKDRSKYVVNNTNKVNGKKYDKTNGSITRASSYCCCGPFPFDYWLDFKILAKTFTNDTTLDKYYTLYDSDDNYIGYLSGYELSYDDLFDANINPERVSTFYISAKVSKSEMLWLSVDNTPYSYGNDLRVSVDNWNTVNEYKYNEQTGELESDSNFIIAGPFSYHACEEAYVYRMLAKVYSTTEFSPDPTISPLRYFSLFGAKKEYLGCVYGTRLSNEDILAIDVNPKSVVYFYTNAEVANGELYWAARNWVQLKDKEKYIQKCDNEYSDYCTKMDLVNGEKTEDSDYRTCGPFRYYSNKNYTFSLYVKEFDPTSSVDRYYSLYDENGDYLGYISGFTLDNSAITNANINPSSVYSFYINGHVSGKELFWLAVNDSSVTEYGDYIIDSSNKQVGYKYSKTDGTKSSSQDYTCAGPFPYDRTMEYTFYATEYSDVSEVDRYFVLFDSDDNYLGSVDGSHLRTSDIKDKGITVGNVSKFCVSGAAQSNDVFWQFANITGKLFLYDYVIEEKNLQVGYEYSKSNGKMTYNENFRSSGPFKYYSKYYYHLYAVEYSEDAETEKYYSLFRDNGKYLGYVKGTHLRPSDIEEANIKLSRVAYFYVSAEASSEDLFWLFRDVDPALGNEEYEPDTWGGGSYFDYISSWIVDSQHLLLRCRYGSTINHLDVLSPLRFKMISDKVEDDEDAEKKIPALVMMKNVVNITSESLNSEPFSYIYPIFDGEADPEKFPPILVSNDALNAYGIIYKEIEFGEKPEDDESMITFFKRVDKIQKMVDPSSQLQYNAKALDEKLITGDSDYSIINVGDIVDVYDTPELLYKVRLMCLSLKLDVFDFQNNSYVVGEYVDDISDTRIKTFTEAFNKEKKKATK